MNSVAYNVQHLLLPAVITMVDFIIKSAFIQTLLMALIDNSVRCTNTEEINSDKSNEVFKADGFESILPHDQNQDETMSGDSAPFTQANPGNYFMDLYSIQTGPKQVEFGHVYENPDTWEQRYEKKDHENKRFQGQARWGDKNGGYGEQYWDYNHGGPDEHEELNKDPSDESSLTVRSPSFDSSPSTYNSVGYSTKSVSALPSSTTYPKREYPKKNKKRYGEPRTRIRNILETSTTDTNYFTLPRVTPSTERTVSYKAAENNEDGPLRIDLYEQLKAIPSTYEHVLQITPSTPRLRSRIIEQTHIKT